MIPCPNKIPKTYICHALRKLILIDFQMYRGGRASRGKKNRGTVITSLQLVFTERVVPATQVSDQFGSMPVLEEAKTIVYVTNHNMITMAMVIFKTYKMADKGEERVLTKILVYSCFIEPFICLFVTMNWEVP